MHSKKIVAAGVAAILWATASPSFAGNAYVGVSRGTSDHDIDAARMGFAAPAGFSEVGDVPRKFFAGYRFNDHFALEGGYFNLSGVAANSLPPSSPKVTTLETAGWDFMGVGILPLSSRISVFGKFGVYWANTEATFNPVPTSGYNYDAMDLMAGVGAAWSFELFGQQLGLRAEWEHFEKLAKNATYSQASVDGEGYSADLYSVGIAWMF